MTTAAEHAWDVYRETALATGARRRQLRKRDFLAGFEACRLAVIAQHERQRNDSTSAYARADQERYAAKTGYGAGDRVHISIYGGRLGTVVRSTRSGMVLVVKDGNQSPSTIAPGLLTHAITALKSCTTKERT